MECLPELIKSRITSCRIIIFCSFILLVPIQWSCWHLDNDHRAMVELTLDDSVWTSLLYVVGGKFRFCMFYSILCFSMVFVGFIYILYYLPTLCNFGIHLHDKRVGSRHVWTRLNLLMSSACLDVSFVTSSAGGRWCSLQHRDSLHLQTNRQAHIPNIITTC